MIPEFLQSNFLKPIVGLTTSGGLWLTAQVTPEVPGVPSWVTALGLPCAFLVAVIYALVATHRALAASQDGRLADRDAFAQSLRDENTKAEDTRQRLIIATMEQTAAFNALAQEMKSRPCQKP